MNTFIKYELPYVLIVMAGAIGAAIVGAFITGRAVVDGKMIACCVGGYAVGYSIRKIREYYQENSRLKRLMNIK